MHPLGHPLSRLSECSNEEIVRWANDAILTSDLGISMEDLMLWRSSHAKSGARDSVMERKTGSSMAFPEPGQVKSSPVVPGHRRVVAFPPTHDVGIVPENPKSMSSHSSKDESNQDNPKCSDLSILLNEDEVKDEGMKQYTATLLDSINNSIVYDGSGYVEKAEYGAEFLNVLDDSLLPIRSEGWFREGLKKTRKTKHLMVHHPHLLSHTYLQTHPEGVLHVLPGWTRKLLISDLSYRFESSGTTQYRAVLPFLGGLQCTVKTYNCAGVMVCKRCSSDFREKGRHITVQRNDANILASAEDLSPLAEARKKVVGVYMGLQAKMKSRNGFCQADVRVTPGGSVQKCNGVPIVRSSLSKLGTFFIGCSGYSSDKRRTPEMKQNGFKNRHYASKLTFEGAMLEFFQDLLSGKETPSVEDERPCTFVRGKHKTRDKCPRHGCDLVHLSCRSNPGDKHSSHTMCVIEPCGYHEDTPDGRKVLFVSCIGEHLHPAPPPVETTVMKLKLFDFLCTQRKWDSLAQLRNAVAIALQQVALTENGPIQLFDGTLTVPRAVLQRRLSMLRPPVTKLAVEVGQLATMAADDSNQYVRRMKIVGEKYVVFLGLDELIAFASHRMAFAGDATFKTVTEETRAVADGRWYLYNIVAHASKDRKNGKSVVVFRALVTGLSRDVYSVIWTYFLKNIARGWGLIRGIRDLDSVSIKVPYLPVPPTMESRCCQVAAITMDFDSAEVLGCADALVRMCGGTVEMHQLGMFIGCSVHLDRDLMRRSREDAVRERSGKNSKELLSLYSEYRNAKSPEMAKLQLLKIKSFDEGWVNWVERNGMGSLISKSLSTMCSESRSLGFADTNVVESQNRRGNALIGTYNRPGEAALKLWEVDNLDLKALRDGNFNDIAIPRGYRVRKDSIIAPSGAAASASGKRKRSKSGGGPAQKRTRKKTAAAGVGAEMSTEKVSGQGQSGKGEDVTHGQGPASARIEEMRVSAENMRVSAEKIRVSAASEEVRLSNRVEHRVSQLLEEVHMIPEGDRGSNISGFDVLDCRMNCLVEILMSVNEARHSIEKVKKALLQAILMEPVRRDKPFRDAILRIYKLCMQPLNATSSEMDGDNPSLINGSIGGGGRSPGDESVSEEELVEVAKSVPGH